MRIAVSVAPSSSASTFPVVASISSTAAWINGRFLARLAREHRHGFDRERARVARLQQSRHHQRCSAARRIEGDARGHSRCSLGECGERLPHGSDGGRHRQRLTNSAGVEDQQAMIPPVRSPMAIRNSQRSLERDHAAELGVLGFVDDAHAALANFREDLVLGNCLSNHRLRIARLPRNRRRRP